MGSDDLVARLEELVRLNPVYDTPTIRETIAALASRDKEIEKLAERCAAYKGQVEAGATEIERLKEDHAREVEDLCEAARLNLEGMLEQRALAATAARERDEARRTEQKLHREMQAREGKLISAAVKKERDFWLYLEFDCPGDANKRREEYRRRYLDLERERDEARAECERLRLRIRDAFNIGHAAGERWEQLKPLHPEGAEDGQS